ncbi:hypothetical protein Cgig2_021461 [Carnegiea gigantea]|uniref:DUF4283 domain-containing protein n=1 Tax=Carnegiea gigantea TaxID=171969 RepID=A0A9Q1GJL8_9CARY|nr:hypothetical protein Cgig2_021461 [Carnegiea gigantea]
MLGEANASSPPIIEPASSSLVLNTAKQPNLTSSLTSLVEPLEGTKLKYIPLATINGTKCAKLDKEDVDSEVEYWQNVVLCSVLGTNSPFEVIKGFLNRIWSDFAIYKILHVRKGVFLVRFENLQDKQQVEKRGIYYFDNKPFLVKAWNPKMDLHTETIKSLPLWEVTKDNDSETAFTLVIRKSKANRAPEPQQGTPIPQAQNPF